MGLDVVERNCNGHVFPVVFPGGASCDCRGFLELLHDRLAGPCAYQSFKYRDGLPSGLFKARGDARECRFGVFADEFVIVYTYDENIVRDAEPEPKRCGKDTFRHCVGGGEDADGSLERGQP